MTNLKKTLSWLFILALLFWLSQPVKAQDSVIDWEEIKTENFIIVYAESVAGLHPDLCACGIEEAQRYQAFIEVIYQDLSAIFHTGLDPPLNLQLYPTAEAYYLANPLAQQHSDSMVHTLDNQQAIAVILPHAKPLSDAEIINTMRHELTHLFASRLSNGNLTAGFQEGIAQYLEQPLEQIPSNPATFQQAVDQEHLLTWSEMDRSRQVFIDPQVAYPQALSMVAFLIDRYGFSKFLEFMQASANQPGYRTALQATYNKSAEVLEAEWLGYLPEYLAQRWQVNAIYNYDLSRVTDLIDKGAYTDAATELAQIIDFLASTHQPEKLAQAEALLVRANQGKAAYLLADQSRQALEAHDYGATITLATDAMLAYQTLGNNERMPELRTYVERADLGQVALVQLEQGEALLDEFRFLEAEQQIREATIVLQSLGNQTEAQRGVVLLGRSTNQQNSLAYVMLAIALILLLFNAVRRLAFKYSANPLEKEYS